MDRSLLTINWVGVLVFGVTYGLVSARRLSWLPLDRPGGALLGAVLFVALGVLTPEEALEAINGETIVLLFGMMGIGAFLAHDGFFDSIEGKVVRFAKTEGRLLAVIVWGAGLLSAFITNDAVCILGAPLVVRLIKRHNLPPLPFLLALATAANTGSVATLVGNPQNMLCALLGGLSYREYLLVVGPLALLCLGINHGLLYAVFRRELKDKEIRGDEACRPLSPYAIVTLLVVFGTAVAYTLGADLAWAATTGFTILLVLHRQDTRRMWALIDWSVLLFFAGLFVVVEGLVLSGATGWFFSKYPITSGVSHSLSSWLRTATIFLLGSNLVSNVPFILVVRDQMGTLPDPKMGWELLAIASTFAGNLTLLGSVANIIVAENARDLGGIGFFEHLKVGFPLAVVTTLVGTLWLWTFC